MKSRMSERGKKGLGNNCAGPRAMVGMREKVLVCNHRPHASVRCRCAAL